MNQKIVVKMNDITKVFGKVTALNKVNFELKKGEIHAILGENGAGKSSLMNVLNGLYMPDKGEIFIKGKKVNITSPAVALSLGIGMLPQHYKLVENFTGAENIAAGNKKTANILNRKKILAEMTQLKDELDLEIDFQKKVYQMAVAEKQSLEIFKVLYRGADILILDEPTAVLTPQEIKNLFNIIRKMTDRGCSIIIITHKLEEVMDISDRVTIMRKGQYIETVNTKETSAKALAGMMVGNALDLDVPFLPVEQTEPKLVLKHVGAHSRSRVQTLKDVSFEVRGGEILGIAGIAGSGQKELCEAIAGLYHVDSGEILFEGENLVGKSPEKITDLGVSLSFVPEDRLGMGLVSTMDIIDNVLLKDYRNKKSPGIDRKPSKAKAERIVDKLDVSTPSVSGHAVSLLSGGNIQKILLGREILLQPKLMVTAYATRGLDVGSSKIIYDLINREKKRQIPIIYIGEDLDVLMHFCDRILVICEGEVIGITNRGEATREEIGLMMSGIKQEA